MHNINTDVNTDINMAINTNTNINNTNENKENNENYYSDLNDYNNMIKYESESNSDYNSWIKNAKFVPISVKDYKYRKIANFCKENNLLYLQESIDFVLERIYNIAYYSSERCPVSCFTRTELFEVHWLAIQDKRI